MQERSEEDLVEIAQCLARSGYFMEARIIELLTQQGFFVEASPSFLDPRTGKTRELDLIAERFDWDSSSHHRRVSIKTNFVVEAINNRFPFVLMTPTPFSPSANHEDYVKCAVTPVSENPFLGELDDFLYTERNPSDENLFSQFAEITRKNGRSELMASHGDGTYQSLLKMSEYIEERVAEFNETFGEQDRYWRLHFWRPMLVLGGTLIVQEPNSADLKLRYADFAQLVFNWHDQDRPRSTVIDIVTERYLLMHMAAICDRDTEMAIKIGDFRTANFHGEEV